MRNTPHSACLTKDEETGPGSPPPNPQADSPPSLSPALRCWAESLSYAAWPVHLGVEREELSSRGWFPQLQDHRNRENRKNWGRMISEGCVATNSPLLAPWGSPHITHFIYVRYLIFTTVQERDSHVTEKETEALFPGLSHQARTGGPGDAI